MIEVDSRIGSADLIPLLKALKVPARAARLEYGDVALHLEGPGGDTFSVGVELKRVGDLLKCIADGRFSGHQLPGLKKTYHAVVLVVEGETDERTSDGRLMVRRVTESGRGRWSEIEWGYRRWQWSSVQHWLLSIRFCGGVHVVETRDAKHTARWLAAVFHWGMRPWKSHNAHKAVDESGLSVHDDGPVIWEGGIAKSPNRLLMAMVAMRFPGVGKVKAVKAAYAWKSTLEMVNGSEEEWAQVVGKATGRKVARAVRGEEDQHQAERGRGGRGNGRGREEDRGERGPAQGAEEAVEGEAQAASRGGRRRKRRVAGFRLRNDQLGGALRDGVPLRIPAGPRRPRP